MSQRHGIQHGTFHITTNAFERIPWCVLPGVPEIIIDNLVMTKNIYAASMHAFCILPNHVHLIVNPGTKGISRFMQSWKSNCMKDIKNHLNKNSAFLPQMGRRVPSAYKQSTIISLIRWANGFHDERIHDSRQRAAALSYVQYNAVRHKLVTHVNDWPWVSLHFPHIVDPMDLWFD